MLCVGLEQKQTHRLDCSMLGLWDLTISQTLAELHWCVLSRAFFLFINIFLRFATANQTASCVYQSGVDYQSARAAAALRGWVDIYIYTGATQSSFFFLPPCYTHTLVVCNPVSGPKQKELRLYTINSSPLRVFIVAFEAQAACVLPL